MFSFRARSAAAFLVLCCGIGLLLPAPGRAVPLIVALRGVHEQPELQNNVMASLKIVQQQANPNLSTGQIRRLHKQAPAQIKAALAPFGYYAVQVNSSLAKQDAGWAALYEITVGPPVRIAQLNVEISGPGEKEKLLQETARKFPLQPGDQLLHGKYEEGKKKLLAAALSKGYLKAHFAENRVAVRQKDNKADIRLVLDTGPLYFFGETSSSQDIISPWLFQCYLPYQAGEVYSFNALNQLQTDLYSTGYFSKVLVEPDLSVLDKEEQHIPVQVQTEPTPTNRYSFGVGYGTDTGARGNVGWKNRRINRFGHKPSVNVQLAENGNRAAAGYDIPLPIFDVRYDALSFDALYFDESWEDTWLRQATVGVSLKHSGLKQQFGCGLDYLHETYDAAGNDDSTHLLMPKGFFTLILANDRVNTEHGIRVNASVKGAHQAVGSSTSFLQFQVGGKAILSLTEKWRLLGRANFGATAMESIDRLPPSLRFYAGGDQSVRGYGYKELGPKNAAGRVVGGQYLTELSGEIERKLFGMWSAAAFYDLGNAYDDIDARLQQGVGIGVRMTLPFGQLRLDLADALSEPGFSVRLHLTLGADL